MTGDKRYGTARWKRVRMAALRMARYKCARCGQPGKQVHHVIPVKDGGAFWPGVRGQRLEVLCPACHNALHPRATPKPKPITYNAFDAAWNEHMAQMVRVADAKHR